MLKQKGNLMKVVGILFFVCLFGITGLLIPLLWGGETKVHLFLLAEAGFVITVLAVGVLKDEAIIMAYCFGLLSIAILVVAIIDYPFFIVIVVLVMLFAKIQSG